MFWGGYKKPPWGFISRLPQGWLLYASTTSRHHPSRNFGGEKRVLPQQKWGDEIHKNQTETNVFFLGSLHLTRDWCKTWGILLSTRDVCKNFALRGFCTTNLYCFAEFLLKSIIHHTRKRLEEVSVSSSWRFGRFLWQEEYICVHLFVKLAVVRWLIGGLGKHQIKLDLIFTQTTFLFRRPKGFFARKS